MARVLNKFEDNPVGSFGQLINTNVQTLASPEVAAFQEINDLVNLHELITRPAFQPDPEFDIRKALEASPLTPTHGQELSSALSQDEFNSFSSRINKSNKNMQTIAGSGVNGTLSMLLAGLISPTVFIPLIGEARGARGIAQTVLLSATAATLQETPSALNSLTRSKEEIAFTIGAGTVLGAILGTTIKSMSRGAVKTVINDLENPSGKMEVILRNNTDETGKPLPRDISPPEELTPDAFINLNDEVAVPVIRSNKVDLKTDMGPNVKWLEGKKQAALRDMQEAKLNGEENGAAAKGLNGSVTNHIGGSDASEVFFPVAELKKLKGVNGERPVAGDVKFDSLKAIVDKSGFNAVEHPIHIRVNHLGEAFISEGNNRVAIAAINGNENIRVKIDWMNGGGHDKGPWSINDVLNKTLTKSKKLPKTVKIKKIEENAGRNVGSAETRPVGFVELKEAGPVPAWINRRLARMNPVTRGITQKISPAASTHTARMSDAGLVTKGNAQGIPHAPEGTMEWRAEAHGAATFKFTVAFDDAYSTHIFGAATLTPLDTLARNTQLATIKSGLGLLPVGKLSWKEFQVAVFKLGNTGGAHPDISIMKAVKAQRVFYDYYVKAADEAYQFQLANGTDPDLKRLFDPKGELGPDVLDFAHHVFDTVKVTENAQEFRTIFARNAEELQNIKFNKSFEAFQNSQAKLENTLVDIDTPQNVRRQLSKTLKEENKAIEVDAEIVNYKKELEFTRQDAKALPDSSQTFVRDLIRSFNQGQPESVKLKLARLKSNKTRLKTLESVKKKGPREKLIKETRDNFEKAKDTFDGNWRSRGGTGARIIDGEVDFTLYGQEKAELLYNDIIGLGDNASTLDILFGKRGPELARVLKIPFEDKVKFLFTDAEHVMRQYAHKLGPDIELYRATGSVTGQPILDAVSDDFSRLRGQLDANVNNPAFLLDLQKRLNPDTAGFKKPASVAELNKKLDKAQQRVEADMKGLIKRFRHQRGFPENSEGILYRLGQAALDINVFRFMGNVVPASVQDISRPVFKHGLMNTYKDGYEPFIKNLSGIKMSREVAFELNIGTDPTLHNRSAAVFELTENFVARKSVPERALGFLANKTGFVALFDRWTAEMKIVAFRIGAAQFSRATRMVVTGEGPSSLASSVEYLAAHGINREMAIKIWKQFELPNGSTEFDNGMRLPNMKVWDDYTTMAAYRAAHVKATSDMIITPGLDRPLWVDYNIGTKMVAQFRSFNLVSTNRNIMAGLQAPDTAVLQGVIGSLGLGAMSYFIWAMSIGGRQQKEMLALDPAKWADEAIDRSGLLGVFAEPLRIAGRVPGLRNYTSFSGVGSNRRRASSLMGTVLGPSFDLGERISNIILGASDPTKSTLHQARLLAPYQNVFYLRRLMTEFVEKPLGSFLPTRRGE